MIGAIGLLIKNGPAIIKGVATLQPLLPKNARRALNKVKTAAVVAGAVTAAAAQPWTAESGLGELVRLGLMWMLPPEIALPAAPVVSTGLVYLAGTTATFITGYMTREDAAKIAAVEPGP